MAAQQQQQQQQQQLTPNPSVATWSPHFWEPSTTTYRNIGRIYTKGPAYTNEDVVWHAWNAILIIYFPQNATTANSISWSIERKAYRGLSPARNPSQTKPDVIVVRLNSTPVPQGQVPRIEERDLLWVESKAASHDKASGWKDVLEESATRLAHAHSTRPLYLIIAVGWKCMFFLWDPVGMVQQQPQCWIRSEDRRKQWTIDTRIKAIRSAPWMNTLSGEITLLNAIELDSWTLAPTAAGTNVLINGNNLSMIELFPLTAQIMPLHLLGINPASF